MSNRMKTFQQEGQQGPWRGAGWPFRQDLPQSGGEWRRCNVRMAATQLGRRADSWEAEQRSQE